MLFSYSPPLSFSERQLNMDNYFFNRHISIYPYRKTLPKKKKKKKIISENKENHDNSLQLYTTCNFKPRNKKQINKDKMFF